MNVLKTVFRPPRVHMASEQAALAALSPPHCLGALAAPGSRGTPPRAISILSPSRRHRPNSAQLQVQLAACRAVLWVVASSVGTPGFVSPREVARCAQY